MGNTESYESNAAGSSEEDSARRCRENMATAVGAVMAMAAVAAAGWAVTKLLSSAIAAAGWVVTKLLSSSASKEVEKTNDKGKSMVAVGTSSGYRIPRNRFEDSPYDYFPDEKTNERQKMMVTESYQIPSNEFEDSHSDSEDEETDEELQYPYVLEASRWDYQISGEKICWRFPGYGKLKMNTDDRRPFPKMVLVFFVFF
ncbi:hypothetical protein RHGRI_027113 [Rhododendron griersonianum]|uniref:Transmembrane protein n=1 Tax=Rhododendron griersonianum TaxID=479676 RepID=A0AAV6IZA5_9ERIC|nr:hypothetical protein RHGRI_027113 [Rhododendron griersonianum]